jgi:hypothetical protein
VRGIILEALNLSRRKAVEAMRRRLESVKYVQDVLELLAKLEGELNKDAGEGGRGVQIILLNNQGAQPLDPETFRAAAIRIWHSGRRPLSLFKFGPPVIAGSSGVSGTSRSP